MSVNPDLLKPFRKVSIRDLTHNLVNETQMVWIQGIVTEIKDDLIELNDVNGESVHICQGENQSVLKSSCGKYYQVLGYYEGNQKVRAVKIVEIESDILQELWPLEVKEMSRI